MEFKDRADFEKWANSFRKLGIKSLKMGDFAVEFDSQALFPESTYQKKKREAEPADASQPLTAEDIAYWSSAPFVPGEMQ